MKKFINTIKKYDIDMFLVVIIFVSSAVFCVCINHWDELWNFANSYKIYNGFKIYRDVNVIITPLFFAIAQMFFKIFGATMMSFRLYSIAINTLFIMLIFKIFKELKIVRRRSIFYTIIMFYILRTMVSAGANYNILALVPILIEILLILKKKNNIILTGTLLFLTFILKQNIFVYFGIGIAVYEFVINSNKKEYIIKLFKIYFVAGIEIIMFLIYLYMDNNLYNFINYCFLGINEFGSKNTAIQIFDSKYLYVSLIIIIFDFIIINNKIIKENFDEEILNNSKVLLSFGLPLVLIAYPIMNYYHSTLGSLVIIISFIYLIDNMLIKELINNREKEKIVYFIVILLYFIWFIYKILEIAYGMDYGTIKIYTNGPYKNCIIQQKDNRNLLVICDYINNQKQKGINVKMLSYKANTYMTLLNQNNGIFDLAFKGNLGKEGEEGLIKEIKELNNAEILIESNEEDIFEQESKIVREYIINNYEKIGEIEEYTIYSIKQN